MSQNTVNYANNPTGPELLDDYLAKEQENSLSSNSGVQRPSYAITGTLWLDTSVTPWQYKIYDGSRDAVIGSLNNSSHTFTVSNINDSNLVHKNGTETINGLKTFGNNINLVASEFSYRHIYSNNTSITKGTAPSTNTGFDYVLRDSASSNIAAFIGWYNTNGDITAALYAYKPTAGSQSHADLKVCNYVAGRADVVFTTPNGVENSCLSAETNSTASTMFPTKGWVNNPATSTNVVHRTENETIGGTKTFSESIIININATRNVAPSAAQFGGIGIRDNANNLFASMLASMDTSKNATAFWRVFNPKNTSTSDATYMSLHYDADGSTYVTAPASDVVNSIVTTVNKSKAANGYFQLGNGLIVQWGRFNSNSVSEKTITLPKAFTSTNYSVTVQQGSANLGTPYYANSHIAWPVNTTTFKVYTAYSESGYLYWIAIGY